MFPTEDIQKPFAVHLLDVGLKEYGDALLCQHRRHAVDALDLGVCMSGAIRLAASYFPAQN